MNKHTRLPILYIMSDDTELYGTSAKHIQQDRMWEDKSNEETTRIELECGQSKPDTFAPAYYAFPAGRLPLFGKPRSYRADFHPCLHTYINKETLADPGVAHVATVTTWTGTILGHVESAHVYRHNFGARMVSMRVRGTNGAMYYGRASWDNGNVIRLRRVK